MISFASHLRSLTEGNPERRFWSVRKMKVPGREENGRQINTNGVYTDLYL